MKRSEIYLTSLKEYLILRNAGAGTIKSYIYNVERFFTYVINQEKNKSVEDHSRSYLLSLHYAGYSWSSINIAYSALLILFKQVLHRDWDYEMTPRPKVRTKLPQILSHEEVVSLINGCRNVKHRTLLVLLYSTGIRTSELLSLRLSCVNLSSKTILIESGKGNKDRLIYISEKLVKIILHYLGRYSPYAYMFEGNGSVAESPKPYSGTSVRKVISKSCKRAGITRRVSPHTFRHSYATHHLDFGTSIEYLRRQLGHASLKTTGIYLHLCQYQVKRINHPLDHLAIELE